MMQKLLSGVEPVDKQVLDAASGLAIHHSDRANDNEYLVFVVSVEFHPYGHYIWWCYPQSNQCLNSRQRRISSREIWGNSSPDKLMNRVIHRSWGEGFLNISLDLSLKVSRSTSTISISDRIP